MFVAVRTIHYRYVLDLYIISLVYVSVKILVCNFFVAPYYMKVTFIIFCHCVCGNREYEFFALFIVVAVICSVRTRLIYLLYPYTHI